MTNRSLNVDRRSVLKASLALAAGAVLPAHLARARQAPAPAPMDPAPLFTISLAQWSLHNALYAKKLDNLDFPRRAKVDFAIDAVEYVNSFFKDKAKDQPYLAELKKRCSDLGVTSVLIMCDGEGAIGDADDAKRTAAVENHYKWVEAAKFLGCHSIRVNAQSSGSWDEQQKRAADGLHRLCTFADTHAINVIVENHGGLSSNGDWLSQVIKMAAHPRAGTLPDFGNFKISDTESFDRYTGVERMIQQAKGVSAKSYDFDDKGDETTIDYRRMLKIVLAGGYRGRIGIEYEGQKLSEDDGIRATKKLLEKLRDELSKPGAFEPMAPPNASKEAAPPATQAPKGK